MTESTTNLTVRVRLIPPPTSPRQPPVSQYRWDRILLVFAPLLIVVSFLAVNVMLSRFSPPVEPAPSFAISATPDSHKFVVASAPGQPSTAGAKSGDLTNSYEAPQNTRETTASANTPKHSPGLVPTRTSIFSERVKRMMTTDIVKANLPGGSISEIGKNGEIQDLLKIYAFSEVEDLRGETLHYRWLRNTELVADVKVKVYGDSWRSHSSKYLNAEMQGLWRVELKTGKGELLAYTEFKYL